MKAIAFDLGDTLVEYEGIPLSWEAHYPDALGDLTAFLGIAANADQIAGACAILRRYNTRLNPRAKEITFAVILEELFSCFSISLKINEVACATAFFKIFRRKLRCFPEAKLAVNLLRMKGLKVGIFTDVPYGMPRELVLEDVREAALDQLFDLLMTSRDVGFRKPSVETLQLMAEKFGCDASEMAYVGNEKKDVDVARAFGCYSILIDRLHLGHNWGQDQTIASLSEL